MDDVSSETRLDWFNNMNFKNIVWFIKAISYFVLLRSLGIIIIIIIIVVVVVDVIVIVIVNNIKEKWDVNHFL